MFSKFKKHFLVFSVFWLVASATYSGFTAKWGQRDNNEGLSLVKMLNGSAHKPFVYRQLLPTTANIIADYTPDKLINFVGNKYSYGPIRDYASVSKLIDSPAKYKFKWLIVYWMGFAMLLGSLYLLRSILSNFSVGPFAAIFAPCIFSLCMPIIQTVGGYVYDYSELFFMSFALYLTLKNRYITLLFVVSLATFNKESFIFFIPALYPFLPKSSAVSKTHIFYTLQLLISVCINIWLKRVYADNPGEAVQIWFTQNIKDYLNPLTYFSFEASYGLLAPKGINVMTVFLVFILISTAWKYLDQKVRTHCLIAFCINFPLFIIAGYTNEIRGLSFLYISLVFLIAYTIQYHEKKFDPLASQG
jgi:hypothetical protein